jgi:hypothetical protein
MFVRFADDTVCVAYDHRDALSVVKAFRKHGYFSGMRINYKKSPGITLLEPSAPTEKREFFYGDGDGGPIKELREFDYIGHKFRGTTILSSSRGINRIKRKISRLIYIHLLLALKQKTFAANRVDGNFYDWDLVTCINEIKNYIYGGLKEKDIKAFILAPLAKNTVINGEWYQHHAGIPLETHAPSFVLGWRAARKAFKEYGLANFERPKYYKTYFEFDSVY